MPSPTPQPRPPRMVDVAAEAGVSRATVSLVLRDSPLVAPATRELVRSTAERLGYVYNRGAASLRTQRRGIVGLVIPDIANPFIAQASIGFQTALAEYQHFVVVGNTLDDVQRQRLVLQSLTEHQVDALLLIPAIGTDAADIEQLAGHGTPVVLLNRPLDSRTLPYVGPDEEAVGRLALEHLVTVHGVGTAAYFGGIAEATPRVIRERTVRARAAELRVGLAGDWCVPSDPTTEGSYAAATTLLARGDPPAGIICHSDGIALGVLRALHERGIGPDRCRIIGVDNVPEVAYWNPSLSSVAVEPERLGLVGGLVLLGEMGRIELDTVDASPTPPALVARESCGCGTPPT